MRIKAETVFVVYILLCSVQYIFVGLFPVPSLNSIQSQVDDLWLIITFVFVMVLKLSQPAGITYRFKPTPIDKWIFIAAPYMVITAILNNVPFANFIITLKTYFLVWILYYCILWLPLFKIREAARLIGLVYWIFYMQLVIQIYQIGVAAVCSEISDDVATGTFPGANALSYAYFFPLFFACYMFLFEKQRQYLFKSIINFSGMVLSWGMFAIMTFPFIFLFFNASKLIKKPKTLATSMIFGVLVVVVFLGIQQLNSSQTGVFIQRYGVLGFFSPKYIIDKFTKDEFNVNSGSARLLWFPVTYNRLKEYAASPLIGMGPGMYASFTASRFVQPPQKSIYNLFGQLEKGLDEGVDSQIIPIWGEFGYVGIGLVLVFLLYMCYTNYRIYCEMETPFERGIALTASAGSIYLLFGMYANHVLESQNIMLFYVLFCALSYRLYRENTIRLKYKGVM